MRFDERKGEKMDREFMELFTQLGNGEKDIILVDICIVYHYADEDATLTYNDICRAWPAGTARR